MTHKNAIFHAFKPSGKWKYGDHGFLPKEAFEVWSTEERREAILKANGGKFPGMSSRGTEMIFVVIPDETCDWGWPLLLYPSEASR